MEDYSLHNGVDDETSDVVDDVENDVVDCLVDGCLDDVGYDVVMIG